MVSMSTGQTDGRHQTVILCFPLDAVSVKLKLQFSQHHFKFRYVGYWHFIRYLNLRIFDPELKI